MNAGTPKKPYSQYGPWLASRKCKNPAQVCLPDTEPLGPKIEDWKPSAACQGEETVIRRA